MTMLRLYEIANEYEFLLRDLVNEETGVLNEQALARLDELKDPLETKCLNITRLFKNMEAERAAIEKERKAMAAREKSLKKQVKRLKDYLLSNMERCDIKEIKCPQFVVKLQMYPSVDIFDAEFIPDEYKKISIEFYRSKMNQDMKKGIDIPGAILVQRSSIRIK